MCGPRCSVVIKLAGLLLFCDRGGASYALCSRGPLPKKKFGSRFQWLVHINNKTQQDNNTPLYLHIRRNPPPLGRSSRTPDTMTTIGYRFEEDRIITPPKRSLLQKLNEKQGALVAHIRLNRNEEQAYRRQRYIEQSRLRTLSSSSTLTVASVTPSNGSAITDRDSDNQDDSDSSPVDCAEDFSVPYQYTRMPKDRESRRKIVDGMQNFMIWKQASYDSDLARPFHISPPQTPESSHSWSSLSSPTTEISDEQLEDWLERPMDADLHRSRKTSAASSSASSTASISTRPSMSSIKEESIEPPKITLTQEIRRKPLPSPPLEVLPEITAAEEKPLPPPPIEKNPIEDGKSKPLPVPQEILKEIAFQPHDNTAKEFRLSRDLLSNFNSIIALT